MRPVNGDGKNTSSELDPSLEVGPGWVKHRSLRGLSGNATKNSAPRECQRNLAVCIVGQLSRLETTSKITNLFQFGARQKTYADVHAFVVLEAGADFYVNENSIQSSDVTCRQDFHSPSDVEALFSPFYKAGLYLKPSYGGVTVNLKNWHSYGDKPALNTTKVLEVGFRQWGHLSKCADLMEEQEKTTRCKYTAVMKIRDNGVVTKPMDIAVGDNVVTKKCGSWGGVNDKFIFAPRKYLYQVLRGPLSLAVQVDSGAMWATKLIYNVRNPEQFLAMVFKHHNKIEIGRKR